ncbi:biosynthetic arginine decarboxylase [Waterburya agarophytonicola K14]|uniref:Biosynthetic arginine decarboxylase n=1 Tax=Waterburya agarophytonicola KI4 TaxID=2874699 RepID=A0A964FGJ1_9CYAN|nr:biosynthetic arginine decarboxylase [Waterburya agarophytonicola]MCC0178960.1 biosynthetic arginine decarboxylase [Waterburya agarophytonicola KI4]
MVNSQPQPQNAIVQSSLIGGENNSSWTIADSARLYNIEGWGDPYFGINSQGNVTVSTGIEGNTLDLAEVVESLKARNLDLPLLIRFPDILADRMARLQSCMAQAMDRYNYQGSYRGVFPIKCNQNRHLIEALVKHGRAYSFGLEAGSKPELMIALASLDSGIDKQALLICNGYKDREYIETALLATKLGPKPILVIEQPQELDLILTISQELDIKPVLGVRAKLDSKGIGRWGNSTGDRAKFGLTIADIVRVVRRLEATDRLDCLQLLHFHIGSQISAIGAIKNAIREASEIYVQLIKLGANMQYLDVGGGLAVDYDGSKTNFPPSKNYNMQNYANDITAQIKDACDRSNVAVPTLISESGRAVASHQSILVFDVLGTSNVSYPDVLPPSEDAPLAIRNFWQTYQAIDSTNFQESYHDAIAFKQEALSLFNFGYLSLTQRAETEQLYWACCHKIAAIINECDRIPDDLENFAEIMASTYYANLSVFQSIPDAWAIDQLFPIMPIHRLNEQPTVKGTLADITCDSDGKIDRFINAKQAKHLLELHSWNSSQPYYLGMFLVGAYQEIMGNLHNLFGDTNVVHIEIDNNGYRVESVVRGDTIKEVLSYVQYNGEDLLETMRCRTEKALQNKTITLKETQKLLQNYADSLNNSTYLKVDRSSRSLKQ